MEGINFAIKHIVKEPSHATGEGEGFTIIV